MILVDEAQDLNKLQLLLIIQWARYVDHLILAGDDDQTIYGFAGAAPELLLARSEVASFGMYCRIVPTATCRTHGERTMDWQVLQREPKPYLPRKGAGVVRIPAECDVQERRAACRRR